ncbi:hypothetical protein [Roseibium aggregatum]|uniref:hypothetical protein n=1 Tax=Roseibium aggregatum TaxID=187304 RepID=UPI001A8D4A7D|nr:hypothetical protein [Roseibium aggregatum]MBN8182018.1 hypothetical protein [Roseibium aggregatum]
MKDSSTGGILAFLIAAPVIVICCGGHAALLASMLSGAIGAASGLDVLTTLLIAIGTGVVILAIRTVLRSRRDGDTEDRKIEETT